MSSIMKINEDNNYENDDQCESSLSLKLKLQESWMAKNTCFDFFTAVSQKEEGAVKNRCFENESGSKSKSGNERKRVYSLKNRFQNAVQIMIRNWISSLSASTSTSMSGDSSKEAVTKKLVDKWFDKLISLHSQECRAYHTLCHLEEMFGFIDLLLYNNKGRHSNWDYNTRSDGINFNIDIDEEKGKSQTTNYILCHAVIPLCIMFHDAIYDAKSASNEEDSLSLYQTFEEEIFNEVIDHDKANDINAQWQYSTKISLYILATKSHNIDNIRIDQDEDENENDSISIIQNLKFFLDADMAVLGKQPDAYDRYASLIREEYIHVPHDIYCQKRAEILQSFVENVTKITATANDDDTKNSSNSTSASTCTSSSNENSHNQEQQEGNKRYIFASNIMRDALEERAVSNLQREVTMLNQGKIPTFSQPS